ncbi:MAG TPA: type II toxin-antitoxin system VapC family toxin [Thermoanaerobaculia bacterium]|nr:type II toxin-antitoxin system VapC family toxin [Thermoanaerobaculia bacterium]
MKFWDTSALVPLIVNEAQSRSMIRLMGSDANVVVSFLTRVELASGIARRLRNHDRMRDSSDFVQLLEREWTEIEAEPHVLTSARRLAHRHKLRAGDAIQLACAVICRSMSNLEFVTLDHELRCAARAEGFAVLPPE